MNEVCLALGNTIGKKGMSESDINKLAEYLMSFFGYTDQTIDNRLTSEDRDVFYMLEEEGFLTTWQEEVHLKKGKLWRIHYWVLKTDQIHRMALKEDPSSLKKDEATTTYDEVPDDCWNRTQ